MCCRVPLHSSLPLVTHPDVCPGTTGTTAAGIAVGNVCAPCPNDQCQYEYTVAQYPGQAGDTGVIYHTASELNEGYRTQPNSVVSLFQHLNLMTAQETNWTKTKHLQKPESSLLH